MATTTWLLTAEEFSELPGDPRTRYELVNGEVVEMPFPKLLHSLLVEAIGDILKAFARAERLGYVFRDNTGFVLRRNPDTVRSPDVSFVVRERMLVVDMDRYIPGAPDMAVEIVSPTDREGDVRAKAREYIAAGSCLVWVVWPVTRSVTVYELDSEPREYGEGDVLDGGDVLPGLSVPVRALFEIAQ